MANPGVAGFDADAVRAGLRLAMTVGLPTATADQPTFFMPQSSTSTNTLDQTGVPFNPTASVAKSTRITHQVPCAIEYRDGSGKLTPFGEVVPSKVVLTLLDQDYTTVQGFEFVVITGQRYFYDHTEPGQGLIDVGIWKVHCRSEDEG